MENTDETSEKKCKTEKLCSKRTGDDASKESCPNYPVRYILRYDHHCEMGEGACVEIENKCRDVALKTKDCFKYKVSDENKENYGCVNILGAKGCKEMKKCEMVEQLEENDNCYNYAPNALGSLCVNNTEKTEGSKEICKSVKTCNYASEPLSADVCSEYQISLENINTHICLFNKETEKCYEEFLCEKVNLNPKGDKNCSDYPVKKENEQTHTCVSNDEKENTCKEIEKCSGMGTKKDITDEECRKHPVYEDNLIMKDYICVAKSDKTGCEKRQLCTSISSLKDGEKCDNFAPSDIKKTCIADGDNKCKEEFLCEKADSGDSDEQCMNYIVSDESKFICLKNTEKSGSSLCKENQLCETVTGDLTDSDCNKYPVTRDNKNTHICVKNTKKGTPCIEKEINPTTTTIILTTITKEIEKITNDLTSNVDETNEEIQVVFSGCSKFNMSTSYFTFNIHFTPLSPAISKNLTFPMDVSYSTYLRLLDEYKANCNLDETNTQSMLSYFCKVDAPTANIKNIKVKPEFDFGQGKVSLAGITPLAKMSMNDLKSVGNKYDALFESNPSIYILDNSTVNRYSYYNFNISGTINGDKPESVKVNQNVALMVNIENNDTESEDETTKEIKCTVTGIVKDNYTLDCQTDDESKYELQSAMSIIEEGILLVNLGNITNGSQAVYNPDTDSEITRYHFKKSRGIGAGEIVAIILACIVAVAGLIGVIYCLRKSPVKTHNFDSSQHGLKIKI